MFNLRGLAGIMEAPGGLLSESRALVYLSQQQAAGSGGDPAPGKIDADLLPEKASKDELGMADCCQRVSWLRSCLLGNNSSLADTLASFKNFS